MRLAHAYQPDSFTDDSENRQTLKCIARGDREKHKFRLTHRFICGIGQLEDADSNGFCRVSVAAGIRTTARCLAGGGDVRMSPAVFYWMR